MKSYKNVELFAKNAPCGSYAAGCPSHHHIAGSGSILYDDHTRCLGYNCSVCEVVH